MVKKIPTIVLKLILIIIVITILYIVLDELNVGWREVSLGELHTGQSIELDLDGDNKTEIIYMPTESKYININGIDFLVNEHWNDEEDRKRMPSVINEYRNYYYIVDLNEDGIIEIIHKTFSDLVDHQTFIYNIYNYKNGSFKKICEFHVSGNAPHSLFVRKNTIKYKYHPFFVASQRRTKVLRKLEVQ